MANNALNYLPLIPEFNGSVDEDYYPFKAIFDKTAKAAGWTNDQMTVLMPLRLRGKAAEIYDHLEDDVRNDWEALQEVLEQKLVPPHLATHFGLAFKRRVQGPTETVMDYAQALQKLVKRAFPEFDNKVKEKLLLDAFVNGLRFDLKRMVLVLKPSKFEAACADAVEIEGHNQLLYGPTPHATLAESSCFYSPLVPDYGYTPTNVKTTKKRVDNFALAVDRPDSFDENNKLTEGLRQEIEDLKLQYKVLSNRENNENSRFGLKRSDEFLPRKSRKWVN